MSLRHKLSNVRASNERNAIQAAPHLGLNKHQIVQPLLKTVGGRPVNIPPEKPADKRLNRVAMDDIDPLAPPLSSGEEEEPSRADIVKTKFSSKQATSTTTAAQKRGTRSSTQKKLVTRNFSEDEEDKQDEDESRKSSQNSLKRKSISPGPKWEGNPFEDDVLHRPRRSLGQKKFGKGAQAARIKAPPRDVTIKDQDSSPEKKILHIPGALIEEREDSKSPIRKSLRLPAGGTPSPLAKRPKMSSRRVKVPESPEESQRPVFVVPEAYSSSFKMIEEEDDGLEITGVTTLSFSRSLSPLSDIEPPSPSVCPTCNEEVSEKVFESFKKIHPGPRMTVRREQLFCAFHKLKAAKKIWKKKGYPDIRWRKLDKRIAKQHSYLRAILEGGGSHYGGIYNEKVKGGQNKTLLKSEDNLTIPPGYYGTRGFQVMSDNLIRKFASVLRERAVQDRLISARGYTTYVHAVLVPELAVQLIKEDMDVDEEKARSIMEESIAVGEIMHEEVADVVLESEEESNTASGESCHSGDLEEL